MDNKARYALVQFMCIKLLQIWLDRGDGIQIIEILYFENFFSVWAKR